MTLPSPSESTPESRPVRRLADQDRRTANAILRAFQLIETVQGNPELGRILAERGYDAAMLQSGLELFQAAQAAFNQRQGAMAAQRQASAALVGVEATARDNYRDFREVARALFKDDSHRKALVLEGRMPRDRQRFIMDAQAAYKAALDEPFQSELSIYGGFSPETLQSLIADLEALAAADDDQNEAIGVAVKATAERDRLAGELDAWVKRFRHIANVALRDHPDLAKALELKR
jgi:hypothetical protein